MSTTSVLDNRRNCSIDLCRFISATFAVMTHAFLFMDINETFFNVVINMVLCRYVVQFFVCITGYYFYQALVSGQPAFKKQFFRLLKFYLLWTIIYYSASFVQSVLINDVPISEFLLDRVIFFFTEGSYPHLWNFPATLYSMIIVTVVYKLWDKKGVIILSVISILLFIVGAFGSPYYSLAENIPLLSQFYNWSGFFVFRSIFLIGLPFVTLGCMLFHMQEIIEKIKTNKIVVLMIVTFILYTIEGTIVVLFLDGVERPYTQFFTYPFVALLIVTLLRFPMPKYASASALARKLANFLYFVHPLVLVVAQIGFGIIGITINTIIMFLLIYLGSIACGFILIKINTNWANTLLAIPNKRKS